MGRRCDLSFRFKPMFEIVAMLEPAGLEEPIGAFLNSYDHLRISFAVRHELR